MENEFGLGAEMPEDGMDASVEMLPGESAEDDALQAPASTLDEFADADEQQQEQEIEDTSPGQKQPPGWLNKRIQAGVAKGVKKEMAAMQAQYNAQLQAGIKAATEPLVAQLNAFQASNIEREAKALVASGEVRDLENAKIIVAQKSGATTPTVPTPSPKSTPQNQPQKQSIDARTELLARQARKLEAQGVPIKSYLEKNPNLLRQVLQNPDYDMHDVAALVKRSQAPGTGKVPTPMRAANSGAVPKITPASMSDAQFERFNKALDEGKVFQAGVYERR